MYLRRATAISGSTLSLIRARAVPGRPHPTEKLPRCSNEKKILAEDERARRRCSSPARLGSPKIFSQAGSSSATGMGEISTFLPFYLQTFAPGLPDFSWSKHTKTGKY
jgi:hypothetical protein